MTRPRVKVHVPVESCGAGVRPLVLAAPDRQENASEEYTGHHQECNDDDDDVTSWSCYGPSPPVVPPPFRPFAGPDIFSPAPSLAARLPLIFS